MSRSARRGFTLVELVLVVLTVGILAAVAAPRFTASMTHHQIEAAANHVAADIRYARRHARTKGANQSVDFTPASDTYDLPGLNDLDHSSQPYTVDLTATPYPATIVSANLGSGGLATSVVFDMYGQPDFGGTVVIAVGTLQRTITIDPVSGDTSITP